MRLSLALLLAVLVTLLTTTAYAAAPPAAVASDGPGALAYFDLGRKDCLGTARNTTSRVWYTIADGVLSDVYYPTLDNTNVKSLELVVTDGSTFTDLQSRDTTYTVQLLDSHALDCRVISTAKNGKYAITTDYLTDPARDSVVTNVTFTPLVGTLADYNVYLRYDPTLNGNGGGGPANSGGDYGSTDTTTAHPIPIACDFNATPPTPNRDYAQPVCSALVTAPRLTQVSNGFVGKLSDGLTQLDSAHQLTTSYAEADNGNLVQTGQADLSNGGSFSYALGFGKTAADASATAQASLANTFNSTRARFESDWNAYDAALVAPPASFVGTSADEWQALVNEYYLNANVVKASEDKTFPGALVASLAMPWGQAISAGDPTTPFVGSYREVFARDAYEAWTGLLLDGDNATAEDVVRFLFEKQQLADGSFPRNSLLNGAIAPDSNNLQLDEVSYPLLMAYQLGITDTLLYQDHIKPAAAFLIAHGPAVGVERWEEQTGYSPSTISAEIAGLLAAASIADTNNDPLSANLWRGVADNWQRSLKTWTVTTTGPNSPEPYFIRLSKDGDPNASTPYGVGNGGPTLDQRAVIDAGFLELVRLGLLAPTDPTITDSLAVVDQTISHSVGSDLGWLRYNGDGYGDLTSNGQPWVTTQQGNGHLWTLLNEERGEYDLATGDITHTLAALNTLRDFSSGVGLIPEQAWEATTVPTSTFGADPTNASIGFQPGHPAGSAAPLTWASGAYIRLFLDLISNRLLEQPAVTYNRYVAQTPLTTTLTVASPLESARVDAPTVIVSGTSDAGNQIVVGATSLDTNSVTRLSSGLTNPDGTFSLTVPLANGGTRLNIVATNALSATALITRTLVANVLTGTVLLDLADSSGDDHGPGNYAYPTAPDFHSGAFDLQNFRVLQSPDGATTTFQVQLRDLSPTFNNPLGAQLLDVYVHDPNAPASDTTTAAAFPQRNYSIATRGAWSRLLEVQGFNPRYIDAHGNSVGAITIQADPNSRTITFSVPTASLGAQSIGKGWGFTVVLTGQDGFAPDQARGFTAAPGQFTFGECGSASSEPPCTADPATLPKLMDVLTPAGTTQSNELDYTKQPITLQPVIIP